MDSWFVFVIIFVVLVAGFRVFGSEFIKETFYIEYDGHRYYIRSSQGRTIPYGWASTEEGAKEIIRELVSNPPRRIDYDPSKD
jgi:hypothetical protein